MTTSTATFRAFVREPFDLALGQPHQILISSASVAIVALEASTLIPWPFNIALAVGAEWAYLRGLISGAGVKTRWAAALNVSAVLLVVLYGSLWGFRSFHLIPDVPPPIVAVLLTLIHIGAIGAVTICSAMLHRAGEDAKAERQHIEDTRARAREDRLQQERDALALEMERKQQDLLLWQQAQEMKNQLKMQSRVSRNAKPQNGTVPLATGKTAQCKLCQKEVAWSTPSEAGTIRRWGCAECRSK